MAGLAHYGGSDYWFEAEAFDRDNPPSQRRYLLYALTDEELAGERHTHREIQRYVGTHMDYQDTRQGGIAGVKPRSGWPKFYEKHEYKSYADRPPIGWFVLE